MDVNDEFEKKLPKAKKQIGCLLKANWMSEQMMEIEEAKSKKDKDLKKEFKEFQRTSVRDQKQYLFIYTIYRSPI